MLYGTRRFKRLLQLDLHSCGVQSVRAILLHQGIRTDFKTVYAQLGTQRRATEKQGRGTTMGSMARVLRGYGARALRRGYLPFDRLCDQLQRGRLVLARVDGDHVLVTHGIDDKYIYLADPSLLREVCRRTRREDFARRYNGHAIVVFN